MCAFPHHLICLQWKASSTKQRKNTNRIKQQISNSPTYERRYSRVSVRSEQKLKIYCHSIFEETRCDTRTNTFRSIYLIFSPHFFLFSSSAQECKFRSHSFHLIIIVVDVSRAAVKSHKVILF